MRRIVELLGLSCLACASSLPAPPAPLPTLVVHADEPAAPAPARAAPAERASIGAVWKAALDGDGARARLLFDRVLAADAEAKKQPVHAPNVEPGLGGATPLVTAGRLVVRVNAGLIVADASSGAPEHFVEDAGFSEPEPVAGTSLVALTENDEKLRLLDVATGKVVREQRMAGSAFATSPSRIAYAASLHERAFVQVESSKDGSPVARIALPEGSFVQSLAFLAGSELLVIRTSDGNHLWHVSDNREVAMFEGVFAPNPISDAAGRWAVVASESFDSAGARGETRLLELATGHVLARSTACSFPTLLALSPDESVLVVGDLRRACLLRMPSLAKLSTTDAIRPSYGFDDDLQNLAGAWFLDGAKTLALESADGSVGLFELGKPRVLYRGRGTPVALPNGQTALVDQGGAHLTLLDGFRARLDRELGGDEVMGGAIPELRGSTAEPPHALADLDREVCRVDNWVVPRPVCPR